MVLKYHIALIPLLLYSIAGYSADIRTMHLNYADSTSLVKLSMDLEIPEDWKGTTGNIRKGLLQVTGEQLYSVRDLPDSVDLSPHIQSVKGLRIYYSETLSFFDSLARADRNWRTDYLKEDGKKTPEEQAKTIAFFSGWEAQLILRKVYENERFIVFESQTYIYRGGSHGGVSEYYITFNKSTGESVDEFLKEGSASAMQPLIRKGLCRCFNVSDNELKDQLIVNDDFIELPCFPPYPCKDGLCFVYQQYEIACYAAGTPSFIIPYSDLENYITPSFKTLINP